MKSKTEKLRYEVIVFDGFSVWNVCDTDNKFAAVNFKFKADRAFFNSPSSKAFPYDPSIVNIWDRQEKKFIF